MKQSFTISELYAHRGCYSKEMVSYCMQGNQTVTLAFIIDHPDMKLTEKAWFLSNHIDMTADEHKLFAQGCADIAHGMYNMEPQNSLTSSLIQAAIRQDEYIDKAITVAGIKMQRFAYVIYAACTRDPYDRIYSACNAVQLAGGSWEAAMLEYFKRLIV